MRRPPAQRERQLAAGASAGAAGSDQMKNRSPVGSIRGTCQLAHPDATIAQAVANECAEGRSRCPAK